MGFDGDFGDSSTGTDEASDGVWKDVKSFPLVERAFGDNNKLRFVTNLAIAYLFLLLGNGYA